VVSVTVDRRVWGGSKGEGSGGGLTGTGASGFPIKSGEGKEGAGGHRGIVEASAAGFGAALIRGLRGPSA